MDTFLERDKDRAEIKYLKKRLKEQSLELSMAKQKIRFLENKSKNFRKVGQFEKFEALGKFCIKQAPVFAAKNNR